MQAPLVGNGGADAPRLYHLARRSESLTVILAVAASSRAGDASRAARTSRSCCASRRSVLSGADSVPLPLRYDLQIREILGSAIATRGSRGARLICTPTKSDRRTETSIRRGTPRCCGLLKTNGLSTRSMREASTPRSAAPVATKNARRQGTHFSLRDRGTVGTKRQRPERWPLPTQRIRQARASASSRLNWTELDVWHYINVEQIPVVPLYFAQEREVVVRGNSLMLREQEFVPLLPGERAERVMCRMRSLGCSPCTGAVRSTADTVPKIIQELITVRQSERQLRVIDHDQDGSMEMKKREGYF